jgi:hypothetical protein
MDYTALYPRGYDSSIVLVLDVYGIDKPDKIILLHSTYNNTSAEG